MSETNPSRTGHVDHALGKTAKSDDPTRTPAGWSSGSAAAVVARMVPLTLRSQTKGSVIRPASYCGVHGFKPSFGLISRRGVTLQAPTVDQVGMFARSLDDIATQREVLIGHDPNDPPCGRWRCRCWPRRSARDGQRGGYKALLATAAWLERALTRHGWTDSRCKKRPLPERTGSGQSFAGNPIRTQASAGVGSRL